MQKYPEIILKPGKDEPVRRFHPWIFSGAIASTSPGIQEGDIVEIRSSTRDYLATGHALSGSIAVKLFSWEQQEINAEFWKKKILAAYKLREALGLTGSEDTNGYRLVYAEGDSLPGLIVDYLNGSLVIQSHSVGMHLAKDAITEALMEIYGSKLISVYDKSAEVLSKQSGYDSTDHFLYGSGQPEDIRELGICYAVDFIGGQKTGFFFDQRENRKILCQYAPGRKVLDMFCYSGSFGLNALKSGAESVSFVDSSKQAVALTSQNILLNGFGDLQHEETATDVTRCLETMEDGAFDLIILDPPAFAKHHAMRQQALKGYRNINARAMRKIASGGILFTFSCSQAIDRQMFTSMVFSAAIEAQRNVRILHSLSQAPDHPVSVFHPEGEYLKGLVLYVD